MSSFLKAVGPMAFSARQSRRCSFCGTPRLTAAKKAPSKPAAPPQSPFIPHCDNERKDPLLCQISKGRVTDGVQNKEVNTRVLQE